MLDIRHSVAFHFDALTVLIRLLVAVRYDHVGFFVEYTVSVLGLSNVAATRF